MHLPKAQIKTIIIIVYSFLYCLFLMARSCFSQFCRWQINWHLTKTIVIILFVKFFRFLDRQTNFKT